MPPASDVDAHPKGVSPFGVMDLVGNVWQWTDEFMDDVYRRMPDDPIWHNGHFFWTDSLASLGLRYEDPGPDHPRPALIAEGALAS